MKKLIALLLVLASVFALAACNRVPSGPDAGGDTCDSHVDEDKNGKCDNCGETLEKEPEGFEVSNAIMSQIENAGSMKLDVKFNMVIDADRWIYDYNEDSEAYDVEANEKSKIEFGIEAVIELSKGKNGEPNAKITADVTRKTSDIDEIYHEKTYLYLIDGATYTYDSENEIYVKSEEDEVAYNSMLSLILTVAESFELPEDEKNEALSDFGDMLITKFNIKDYKGSISFDLKEKANELIDYFKNLDLNTKKLSELIDDALALTDTELTTAKILEKLERTAGLTVNEAITELDKWLTEEENTTVQGLIDKYTDDEKTELLIKEIYKIITNVAEDEELTEQMQAEVDAFIAEMRAFVLSDFIAENELGDVVLYELIAKLIAPEAAPTKDEFFDSIEQFLDMSLAEFEQLIGDEIISDIKETLSIITVEELMGNVDINFKGIFNIDTVEGKAKLGIVYTPDAEVEGKTNTFKIGLTLEYKLYEISEKTIDIALPDGAKIIPDVLGYYTTYNDEIYYGLNLDIKDGKVELVLSGYTYETNIEIKAHELPLDVLFSDRIEVDGSQLEILCNGVEYDHDESEKLIVWLYDDSVFKIETVPTVNHGVQEFFPVPDDK